MTEGAPLPCSPRTHTTHAIERTLGTPARTLLTRPCASPAAAATPLGEPQCSAVLLITGVTSAAVPLFIVMLLPLYLLYARHQGSRKAAEGEPAGTGPLKTPLAPHSNA